MHLSVFITAILMDKYTLYYLKRAKNLVCRIVHYIIWRNTILAFHLLFLLIQFGGYINDWYEAHQQQKDGEKTPYPRSDLDRALVEVEEPIGTTVRVAGSYYNE